MPDAIMDVRQTARYLQLSEYTVRKLARQESLPAFKAGGSWRFRTRAIDAWADAQQALSGQAPDESAFACGRILVVDDDANVQELLFTILQPRGYAVTAASSGPEALNRMREQAPDLVFLDLKMEGMDGAETLKAIRKGWGFVPVVILTGYPESDMMRRALDYSPVTMVSKPFSVQQIVACAKHICQAAVRS